LKKAFTLVELIIVIAVIGILSTVLQPRLEQDRLQEAIEQVLKHIRYTQHLAMNNDVYDHNENQWYKRRWQIQFTKCLNTNIYRIYSDTNLGGSCDHNEAAIDPQSNLSLYFRNGTCKQNSIRDDENINLYLKYDIANITFSGGCPGIKSIGFDIYGRPYSSVNTSASSTDKLMYQNCLITLFLSNGKNATITLEKETGYVRVTNWSI